ncbi:hypothetical protein SAMN05216338_106317 [Bradyrhizobium sp. Rc2d]|uniref:hypothetical protein n=1 Tax=Bradyrhizobium sp. Rc2d TaxID=1855321 RepID=UPI00089095C9|nr:hypothetical protein [Bradyrhizobium sp. Rc2d]SDJ74262.1 hypothetical protein SAMN05216338_106317 [Bradyrhizobium sp. Rc2d]
MSNTGWKEDLARDLESYGLGETPSRFEMARAPVIENWTTQVRRVGKEFKLVVMGQARKHPDYVDGEDICTAAIHWFDRKARFARSAHRLYSLGEQAGDEIPIDGTITE